ncbi:MAG: cation-transporting P-type ATPase [Pseudomonadales bacterium]|nr:cation-transporting P-type ATPase [Pseudomonadales bacterium]
MHAEAVPAQDVSAEDRADGALPWHARPVADCFAALESDPSGLDRDSAATRLRAWGPNRLRFSPPPDRLRRLLRQFDDRLLQLLMGAGRVTALLGEWVETGVIFGVVLINAIIGHVQEGRAVRALERWRVGALGAGLLVLVEFEKRLQAPLRALFAARGPA